MTRQLSRGTFLTLSGPAPEGTALPRAPRHRRSPTLYAFVSSWTSGANGAGAEGGIRVFAVEMRDGSLRHLSTVATELNAGYICLSPDGRFLYATDERKDYGGRADAGGGVVSFAIDRLNGSLTRLNAVPSMGAFPAYIAIDATGTRVVTANHGSYDSVLQVVHDATGPHLENVYDDSTVALFPVGAGGGLDRASAVAVLERGQGAGWEQDNEVAALLRASAHAHSVNFDPDNRFLLACDKGRDRIYVYRVGASGLEQASVFAAPAGTAPRHSAFHPTRPYVFIIDELVPRLSSFAFNPTTGELQAIQAVPTVSDAERTPDVPGYVDPSGVFVYGSMPADVQVHPSGRFVYGSTRGTDNIACFKIDEATGRMTPIQVISSGGKTPRGFNIEPSGGYLFVGNQESDEVVTFAIDPQTGRLSPTGAKASVPRPVCIKFAML